MKKRLEADLISIAHRILKLKNKSELIELHQETQKLYEKLSVLRFVEENFGDVKPTIGFSEIKEQLETAFTAPETTSIAEPQSEIINTETSTEETAVAEVPSVIEEKEQVTAPQTEETQEPVEVATAKVPFSEEAAFLPAFELSFEAKTETPQEVKPEPQQISFEELLGHTYTEPVFEKVEETTKTRKSMPIHETLAEPEVTADKKGKSVSLNDTLSKTISIGLNDRIGFEKHLFSGSSEDLNRVLSQLNTFDNLQEATTFITTFVKPDYNNWNGKEEYENRFMELVEKKFA